MNTRKQYPPRFSGARPSPVALCALALGVFSAACQNEGPQTDHAVAVSVEALVSGGSSDGALVAALHDPSALADHCIQEDILLIEDDFERGQEAFECGDELFDIQYNALDGAGARVGDEQRFSRVPRADKRGSGEWFDHYPPRKTGPNADACVTCHSGPPTGAGPAGANVIRDPLRTGKIGKFINRQTPHLMGSGALQLLAEEMTTKLHNAVNAGQEQACEYHRKVWVRLEAKGVSFGKLRINCDGKISKRRLKGIDKDLVVKPFQWKGSNTTLRDFNRGASHNELGMQPVELTGTNVDGDGDGIANEFGIGDMSAMAVYIAGQPRPTTKLELHRLGLLSELEGAPEALTREEREAIRTGEDLFEDIGCADCHKPKLLLNNPVFSEPSRHPEYRDAVFPAGQDPVALGVTLDDPILFDLTHDQPDNVFVVDGEEVRLGAFQKNNAGKAVIRLYGDLKRHNMGARLAENVDEDGNGASTWLTKELWGVGSTAPYMHDGRSTTLTEAILEHGGESSRSRRKFVRLSRADQSAVIAFMDNLVLLKTP